jgi:hypothetical protein
MTKIVIALVVVFIFFLGIGCESSPPSRYQGTPQTPPPSDPWSNIVLNGEDESLLEGTTWVNNDLDYTFEFRAGGRLIRKMKVPVNDTTKGVKYDIPVTANGTWQRDGNVIIFIVHISSYRLPGFDNNFYLNPNYCEGKYYPQTQSIMGFTKNQKDEEFDFTLIPIQGSSISSVPSNNIVNVQPSVPVQSAAQEQSSQPSSTERLQQTLQDVNKTIQGSLQNGRYRMSGRTEELSFSGIANSGSLFFKDAEGKTSRGTYTIKDDLLTINVLNRSFFYTIINRTSFTGHEETWIHVGF